MIQLFENDSDIDLHRTLTLQLLRFQYDQNLIQHIINTMPDDSDQTNAYYIAKFIRLYRKKYAVYVNEETIKVLESTNKKWPMNCNIRDLKNDFKKLITE